MKTEIIKQPVLCTVLALLLTKQKTADQVTETAVLHFTISFLLLDGIDLEKLVSMILFLGRYGPNCGAYTAI